MASSVHAHDYANWKGPDLIDPYALPTPDSPYGASKVFMEALRSMLLKRRPGGYLYSFYGIECR